MQTVSNTRTEEFEMNWKDSQLLEPKKNETIHKVSFNDYKGVNQVYGGPSIGHEHVLLTRRG